MNLRQIVDTFLAAGISVISISWILELIHRHLILLMAFGCFLLAFLTKSLCLLLSAQFGLGSFFTASTGIKIIYYELAVCKV